MGFGVLVGRVVFVGAVVAVGLSVRARGGVAIGLRVAVAIGLDVMVDGGVVLGVQKQAEANVTGSVRHAMRITNGRGFMMLPQPVQTGIGRRSP